MSYSPLVGTTQGTAFDLANDPHTINLAYPAGIAADQLALITSCGFAAATPSGWTAIAGGLYFYRKLTGSETGTVAVTVDLPGTGGPLYLRTHAAMAVLSENSPYVDALLWDGAVTVTPFNPPAVSGQDTNEVLYMALAHHVTGLADSEAGWSVLDHVTINWDGTLTVLASVTDEHHGDPQTTTDAGPQSSSYIWEVASGPVTGGTMPATSSSITWDSPPPASPGGPNDKHFLRSSQAPTVLVDEAAYWGIRVSLSP